MAQMPELTAADVIKVIHADGWREDSQRGSHRQFEHASKPGKIAVAIHTGKTVAFTHIKTIFNAAGLHDELKQLRTGTPMKKIIKSLQR